MFDLTKTCTFTGHRPGKLYGYSLDNPKYQVLAKHLLKVLRHLVEVEGVRRFITGGAIGYDTVAFFCVERIKGEYEGIENVLAVPFKNQPALWNEVDKERYSRMLKLADKIVYVDELDDYKVVEDGVEVGDFSPIKLQKRNEYMVDSSNYMIALWDGVKSGGTYNCLTYLNKQSHFLKIGIMHPKTLEVEYKAL